MIDFLAGNLHLTKNKNTRVTILIICFYEQIWLENCPVEFKPAVYRRFVDDTVLLFRSYEDIEKFRAYLNCQHPNIKFTMGLESTTT